MSAACLVCEATAVAPLDARRVRCGRCGFVSGERREPASLAYPALYAAPAGQAIEERRRRLYAAVLASLRPSGSRRALDVGCGPGLFVRLAAAAGWTAVGIDPAASETHGDGFRLVRGAFPASAETLGAPFALVTFLGSLNYMDDPVVALRAARALLEPGGLLLVRVPNVSVHLAVVRVARTLGDRSRAGAWLRGATILHPRSFSPRALGVAIRRAGFAHVRVAASAPVPGDPYASGAAALGAVKAVVGAVSGAVAALSGGRLLVSPSLEARARRGRC